MFHLLTKATKHSPKLATTTSSRRRRRKNWTTNTSCPYSVSSFGPTNSFFPIPDTHGSQHGAVGAWRSTQATGDAYSPPHTVHVSQTPCILITEIPARTPCLTPMSLSVFSHWGERASERASERVEPRWSSSGVHCRNYARTETCVGHRNFDYSRH